jgi:membrane-associated phospholipid phosphatase
MSVTSIPNKSKDSHDTTWLRVIILFIISILVFAVVPEFAGQDVPASQVRCPSWVPFNIYNKTTVGWCQTNYFDVTLTKLFRAKHPKVPGLISHVFTMGFSPVIAFVGALSSTFYLCCKKKKLHSFGFVSEAPQHAGQDCLIILSCLLFALGLNSFAKIGAKRQRPCFEYNLQNITEASLGRNEQYLSFFSGDATAAFVTYTSGIYLATLRNRPYVRVHWQCCRGYVSIPVVSFFAGFFASLGAFLRIVAFMHWTTDVLTGVFVGSMCGFGLPMLVFQKKEENNKNRERTEMMNPLDESLLVDLSASSAF